jgi:hypothetical protein
MTQKEKFNDTVSILVKAYLNETLVHGSCVACAVGNIIADKCGYKYVSVGSLYSPQLRWKDNVPQRWIDGLSNVVQSDQTIATGYTVKELSVIERAFECSSFGENDDEWMFNGLMNVVDVLAEIHGIDLTEKEEAKTLFVKA